MIPRAIGIGLVVFSLGRAAAQTAADAAAAIAITSEQEKTMAGQAQSVTHAALQTVTGAVRGTAGQPAALPSGASAPSAEPSAAAAAMPPPGAADPNGATAGDAPPASLTLKRDPFRPFTLDLRAEVQDNEVLTPLQRYEIPQLRLVGVVLDLRPPRAMLQDNSGMGFIVTPGTPIGRRHGVVKGIEPRRVVVEEHVLDYYGREQVREEVIEMPRDDKPQIASQERQ